MYVCFTYQCMCAKGTNVGMCMDVGPMDVCKMYKCRYESSDWRGLQFKFIRCRYLYKKEKETLTLLQNHTFAQRGNVLHEENPQSLSSNTGNLFHVREINRLTSSSRKLCQNLNAR